MMYKVEAKQGNIIINKAVIGKIILEAIGQFKGRIWISNHKGKIVNLKQRWGTSDGTDYMYIAMGEKGLDVRVNIVIRFGTSIGMVTEQLIHDIKYDIERLTGIEANSIAIVVTGLISKQITRRNIEVKG